MYTLVLMTAMAGGPEASRFDGWGGCTGCSGSACYSSCYGTSCVGCHGYGPLFPRARAFLSGVGQGLHAAFAPVGTYRSLGCYSSCSGCHGCWASCHGCSGSVYLGSSVYGGCYGSSCVGCHGCGGGVLMGAALPGIPAVPMAAEAAVGQVAFKPATTDPASASLVISLPAAAKLYVDGQLVAGDGASRRFHTPPLAADKSFFYELKAELLVGGKVETEEAKVVIKAGDSREVSFGKLAAAASAGAAVAAR